MESEQRICQNCKKDFNLELEDFDFYEKMKVPAPTWCPECRMERRTSFANTWNIYWRNCDKCGNKTLSMFHPEHKLTVYCQPCWWSDSWDGTEYAMDYDFNRPFFEQLKELKDKTPHSALETEYLTLKNSEYCNSLAWSKDCYMIFWADFCEGVFYSSILNGLKFSSDCLRGWKSELCYESTGFIRSYNLFFSEDCDDCVDVYFSRNCYGCTNCIGCANLRGESYSIFNVKYSKEDYAEKIKEFGLNSWSNLQKLENQSREFWLTLPYREFHGNAFNLNVTGEHVYVSKNSKDCYILSGAENCKYCQFITVDGARDCMDYSGWGHNASMLYECVSVGAGASMVSFSQHCFPDSLNLQYCIWNISGKNNFGCVNLKRKSYCILNKEYSKEEYEKLKIQIIKDMEKNPYTDELGRVYSYGEFFPLKFSNFSYNKSNAMKFLSKTREQVLAEGYSWSDIENLNNKCTLKASILPETIKDTQDIILNEVIECMNCNRGYKITKGEFDLLRKMSLPIPHECPKCRENRRFDRMNKPGMHNRTCDKCKINIYTPYAVDRPEIVYCVKCYQGEFI